MSDYRATIRDDGRNHEYTGRVIHEFKSLGTFIFRRDDYFEDRLFDTKWWRIIPDE